MNNGGVEVIRTYNIGNNNKVVILNNGNYCFITQNSQTEQWNPDLPYQVGALKFFIKEGRLLFKKMNNNKYFLAKEELVPSAMWSNGTLIDFDNYDQLWSSMGLSLRNIYSTWRSNPVKIPNHPSYIKNQFKKAFILMGKNGINLNSFIDYKNAPSFNTFLDFAKTILGNTKRANDCHKLNTILESCCLKNEKIPLQTVYNQKIQQLNNNNQGFYQNNFNQLNNFNNQEYIKTTKHQQQKLNIIQATFNQNNLQPLPRYKKFFGDSRFIAFLAWYAKLQNLQDYPNANDLAGMLGKYNPNSFEQNRCNNLLNSMITINDGGQSWNIQAGNDKILAYYIGYILFSDDPQTQDFGRLFAIQTIFPWAKKYSYNQFGLQTDWFPESKPPLVGGVEICQPKPVDEDVKKFLENLSKKGVNGLGSEYQVNTNNGTTTIRKGDKLIFEGKLNKDGKGFTDGTLVIKYDNHGQPDEYYQGQFKGTKMEGKGTYVFAKRFPDKEKHEAYKGQFKDGLMHGSGTYYTADGFSAEITYNNGYPINVKKAKDRSNTDVIVFDFFGFGSEAFEDKVHGGRYNSSFFITDNSSYQYKREKIFKLKDEEGMPGLYQQPNEGQQKAMDFIKTHLLIQGAKYYTKLLDEKELLKIPGFDLRKAIKEFCGDTQLPQLSEQAKEKWLCFVIDNIGPDAFNKLYLEDNINYHFGKIQQNTDKKLKIVLNIHGTPQLGMSFGPKTEGYNEKFKLINDVFQKAASLGRDMYVSNNSCYGSQFLDDKQNIFKQIGVDIFENKADFKPIITHTGINESINKIKNKYRSTDDFLKKCKLKAEANSWRLTKQYSMIDNDKGKPLLAYQPNALKDFFVNTFCNVVFELQDQDRRHIIKDNNLSGIRNRNVSVLTTCNVIGTGDMVFLKQVEDTSLSKRIQQPFGAHISEFSAFVKYKLFENGKLDKLTAEGREIENAITVRKEMVNDIIKQEKGKYTKEWVLERIDQACKALKTTKKDTQQIEQLKQKISERFVYNGKLEHHELIKMLSEVDIFYYNSGSLFKKFEDEFVKQKMEQKLKENNVTLEQLDEFGNTEVNKMLGHLSTSIWLTRSFLLGGVLSKKMGVDKILEGFREKCYRLLYKFGDQEFNNTAITELHLELNQELGKIKKEIKDRCEKYINHIEKGNWQVVKNGLQALKSEILQDNYYTASLGPQTIEKLRNETFGFDKNNLINFLQLLPEKIGASMDEAKKNIVNYCENIKNNNQQNIKGLLKQLKNRPMQNNKIIYSANMTGMTPSYMFEMVDSEGKRSNRNLGKMYYEVKNNQIEPLVADKQKYQKALSEFENQLANTEKMGSANDTPGLEGIKFHDFNDIKRIQSNGLMRFVQEGKNNKNKLMGWVEKEKMGVADKFPEDNKRKQPQNNVNKSTLGPQDNVARKNQNKYRPIHNNNLKYRNQSKNNYGNNPLL